MRRLLALAVLAVLFCAAPASSSEHHRMTYEFASWVAVDYWAQRDITIPCRPTHYTMSAAASRHANDVYDGEVAMLTDPDGCSIAISPVADSYRPDPDLDWMYCQDIVHEYGHLAGFADTDDNSIMDLAASIVPFGCAHPRQWTVLKGWRQPPRWVRKSPVQVRHLWLAGRGYQARTARQVWLRRRNR